jgi:hypothetical protein
MTTAEANRLADRFTANSRKHPAGSKAAEIWHLAAKAVLEAEGDSLAASLQRSINRRSSKLGLRLSR